MTLFQNTLNISKLLRLHITEIDPFNICPQHQNQKVRSLMVCEKVSRFSRENFEACDVIGSNHAKMIQHLGPNQ